MKANIFFLPIVFIQVLTSTALLVPKGNPAIENLPDAGGWINWERLIIKAIGVCNLPGDVESEAEALEIARAAATTRAHRNLALVANSVRVSGNTYIKDLASNSEEIRLKLEDFVKNGQIVSGRQLCDRSYEIIIQATLCGKDGITAIISSKTPNEGVANRNNKLPLGLVIDARSIDLKPCLFPVIFNLEGQKILDTAEIGLVAYSNDAKQALKSKKNRAHPIVVKALGKNKKSPTDIMVNTEDAARILEAKRQTGILSHSRVLVLIGSPK
ncbi:MAG: hypothetical protein K6T99_05995 [Armatimonadetes bacterium]|nr:hypothetical protein [Armatimonadota bacterium]